MKNKDKRGEREEKRGKRREEREESKEVSRKKSIKSTFGSLFSIFFFLFSVFSSCKSEIKDNSDRFKKGVFEIPAGKNFVKETIIRKDSIQISKYDTHIDTLSIKWKNNFFYTLRYINPKNDLQKDPMFVQINKIHENSYDFTVKIGFSKFSTKGTVYKVK